LACSGPKPPHPDDEEKEPRGVNVDPDGIYRFGVGNEVWINARNGDSPYGDNDLWTNSRNETLSVYPAATWTGGETEESLARDERELRASAADFVPIIEPEEVPFLPDWWWFAYRHDFDPTVIYMGTFVEAPRGFRARVYVDGGDVGRTRAAAIFESLRFE
jgi:hypothetical protein